ncbi:MAG: DUF4344 domain-containing metallopeptidase, partial [Rhodobacterales bacterium]|nr:DUF4344 domain-containing metallopeptidase [Rhodobacterales bacterium]
MKTISNLTAGLLVFFMANAAVAGEKNPVTAQSEPVQEDKFSPNKQSRPADLEIDPAQFEFVRANLIATFYHELAHAMIDTMALPVLAQEEDAADVFSALMIEHLFDPDTAKVIVLGALKSAKIDASEWIQDGRTWDYSDEHGHDLQRYYNLACLYYGADPENRADFATAVNLPEDRAEKCGDEYDLASNSWGPIIAEMAKTTTSEGVANDINISFSQTARSKETLNNMAFGMRKLSIAARVHGTSRFAAAFATVLPRSPDFRQTPPS